jgi:hypothetical protein
VHIKFLRHGAGSPHSAIQYLLRLRDHKNVPRTQIKVLRGDPQQFSAIAASLPFALRYTSGVVAWSRDDNPSDAEIDAVLDDYLRLALGGLDPNRHSWCAVLHRDQDGASHVHVLHARVDLETGLSLNVAPPNHLAAFDNLRDFYNYSRGWDRPDDPTRARLVQPSHPLEAQQLRYMWASGEPTTRSAAKAKITDYLLQRIVEGSVKDRADMVLALAEIGTVKRQGKDYISLAVQGFEQHIRLKGLLFHDEFSSDTYGKNRSTNTRDREVGDIESRNNDARAEKARRIADPNNCRLAAEASERLESTIAKRTSYNTQYYNKRNDRAEPDRRSDDQKSSTAERAGEAKLSGDGLVEFDHIQLVSRTSDVLSTDRVDSHTDQLNERIIDDQQRLDSVDRSELDSLPISSEQTESMQTSTEIKEIQHASESESERDRDEFAQYIAAINADQRRAAARAGAIAQRLREIEQRRLEDARQRTEAWAETGCSREAHRSSQHNRDDLIKLRSGVEGLRECTAQQGGFAERLREFCAHAICTFAVASRQINGFIDKISAVSDRMKDTVKSWIEPESTNTPKPSSRSDTRYDTAPAKVKSKPSPPLSYKDESNAYDH